MNLLMHILRLLFRKRHDEAWQKARCRREDEALRQARRELRDTRQKVEEFVERMRS